MSVFHSTCREGIWPPHPVWTLWRGEKHIECARYGNTTIRSVVHMLVIVSAVLSWFRSGSKSHSFVILNITYFLVFNTKTLFVIRSTFETASNSKISSYSLGYKSLVEGKAEVCVSENNVRGKMFGSKKVRSRWAP